MVCEAATWNLLGLHDRPKPIALLDGGAPGSPGFWSHLERFLDHTVDEGFVKPDNRSLVTRVGTVAQVLALVDCSYKSRFRSATNRRARAATRGASRWAHTASRWSAGPFHSRSSTFRMTGAARSRVARCR